MKKTLVTLLVVALMLSTFGTVSFAATEAEMTPIPDAPAIGQRYVHMQGAESIGENLGGYLRGVDPNLIGGNAGYAPLSRHIQLFGKIRKWDYQAQGAGWVSGSLSRTGFKRYDFSELAFQSLGTDEKTHAIVNSGYLMLQAENNVLNAPGASVNIGLVSGKQIGGDEMHDEYYVVQIAANETGGATLRFRDQRHPIHEGDWGVQERYSSLDVSDYVTSRLGGVEGTEQEFDLKILANMDNDTYSIYIDNRPVVLSAQANPDNKNVGGFTFATICTTGGWEAMFGTMTCYPMTEAEVNQFRQATWERAFNTDNFVDIPDTGKKGIHLFTAWGGSYESGEHSPEYSIFFDSASAEVDWGNKMTLKHEGLGDLSIAAMWTEPAGCNYNKVYLTATNFEEVYDYDKLNLVILTGEPKVNVTAGTVSGTYIAAGGLGMQSIPRVISASYTKTGDYEAQYDAKITEGANGVYSGDISEIDIPETDNQKLVHYIWGGFDRITPLFGEQVLSDFAE